MSDENHTTPHHTTPHHTTPHHPNYLLTCLAAVMLCLGMPAPAFSAEAESISAEPEPILDEYGRQLYTIYLNEDLVEQEYSGGEEPTPFIAGNPVDAGTIAGKWVHDPSDLCWQYIATHYACGDHQRNDGKKGTDCPQFQYDRTLCPGLDDGKFELGCVEGDRGLRELARPHAIRAMR